jgi:hypothetical protein
VAGRELRATRERFIATLRQMRGGLLFASVTGCLTGPTGQVADVSHASGSTTEAGYPCGATSKSTATGPDAGAARAEIVFKNDLSPAFRLRHVLFVLDGVVRCNKDDDSGALAERKEILVFNDSLPPGDHTLQLALFMGGFGYGDYSYLRGYKFDIKSSHSFAVPEAHAARLEVIAYERGTSKTPLEERPAIRFNESIRGAGVVGDGGAPTRQTSTQPSPAPPSSGTTSPEQAAQTATDTWLALVDAGQYVTSWTEAATSFKKGVDQSIWEKQVTAARSPLGKIKGRALKTRLFTKTLSGAPDGEYVVITFDAWFEHQLNASETITSTKDTDGVWRVMSYVIK